MSPDRIRRPELTAIEEARAALAKWDADDPDVDFPSTIEAGVGLEMAIRALIAEHERLTADRDYMVTNAEGLYRSGVRMQAESERLTTPPTDDEREALAAAEFPEGEFTNWATILAFREAYLRGFDVGLRRERPVQEHVDGLVVSRRNMEIVIRERDAAREALANTMRRQGPITEEWEYATRRASGGGLPYLQYDLESARRFIDNPPIGIVRYEGDPFVAIRRRKAGPWEPVEAARAER